MVSILQVNSYCKCFFFADEINSIIWISFWYVLEMGILKFLDLDWILDLSKKIQIQEKIQVNPSWIQIQIQDHP